MRTPRPGRRLLMLAIFAMLALPAQAWAQANPTVVDPNLAVRTVATGLSQPTGLAFIGANDMLVNEKASGRVIRIRNGVVEAPCSTSPSTPGPSAGCSASPCTGASVGTGSCICTGRESYTGADSGRPGRRGRAGQPGGPLPVERLHPGPGPRTSSVCARSGRRRPDRAREPQRRRGPVRPRRQALRDRRRHRAARLDCRTCEFGPIRARAIPDDQFGGPGARRRASAPG